MPISMASLIHGKWLFSSEACTFNAFINQNFMGVSLITMTCTAVIRYLCVVKAAIHQQYVKPKTLAIGISVLWLVCLIIQTTAIFVSSHGFYEEKRKNCIYKYRLNVSAHIFNFSALAGAIVLGSTIFFAYFKVSRFVSHHNHTVASNLQPGSSSHIEEAKITKTLLTVVLGFVFCWVPVAVTHFIQSLYILSLANSECQILLFYFKPYVYLLATQ